MMKSPGAATSAKVVGLLALVAAAFLIGDGATSAFGTVPDRAVARHWSGLGVGLVAALWAYNGWQT